MLFSRTLAPKTAAEHTKPILFLHGLLGSHMNLRTPAKKIGDVLGTQCHLLDMPHHGKSTETARLGPELSYGRMAEEVLRWMDAQEIEDAHVVGHSMGGKAAMAMCQMQQERISSALIVDIAPVNYSQDKGFALNTTIIEALRQIPLDQISTRHEADEILSRTVPEAGIRAFVLMNLEGQEGSFGWKCNLEAIALNLPNLASWEPLPGIYDGPVTFLCGANSNYIRQEHRGAIQEKFPQASIHTVPAAGHWIHAENPKAFHELAVAHFD